MYRLYDYLPSGNGYKVRLTLKYLRLPYELVELDIKQGARSSQRHILRHRLVEEVDHLSLDIRSAERRGRVDHAFLDQAE